MRTIGRRKLLISCACAMTVAGVARAQAPATPPQPNDETTKDASGKDPSGKDASGKDASGNETALARLARLAEYLSQNAVPEALACFDPRMKDYAQIEADIGALGAQTDVLCAIDIVSEQDSGDECRLDTDWFVELRSQADSGPVERRRERVQITMKRNGRQWKIVAMSPVSILAPIHIQ